MFDGNGGIREADAFEFAGDESGHRGIGAVESEFDAGRAAVDRKDSATGTARCPLRIRIRRVPGLSFFKRFPHRADS